MENKGSFYNITGCITNEIEVRDDELLFLLIDKNGINKVRTLIIHGMVIINPLNLV